MHLLHSHLRRLSSILTTLLGLVTAGSALANTGHEGWYQVEMIVFARRNPVTEEQWPKAIKLRYPTRFVELKNPDRILPNATDSTTGANSSSLAIDWATEPYWQLPVSEQSLDKQAKILERNPSYQVLFHQAWRQEITNAKQAKSILISGGRTYGKHQELEGSIAISVATYLKISTNLWFSRFNVDLNSLETDPTQTNSSQEDSKQASWPEIPPRPVSALDSTLSSLNGLQSMEEQPDVEQTLNAANNPGFGMNLASEDEKELYTPNLIVLMKQERDMRSNEIHYLDHPILGIIIKITPR